MAMLLDLIGQYGVFFVFACVLIEQAGAPIPAYPALLVAGSLAATGQHSAGAFLAAACPASDGPHFSCSTALGASRDA